MRIYRLGGLVLALLPLTCGAGEIYGSVRAGGRPVANVPVALVCASKTIPGGATDAFGAYRIAAPLKGPCAFKSSYQNVDGQAAVYLAPSPTRYDFE